MDKPRLLTKNFLIAAFVNFFAALNYYLLMVSISAFSVDRLHSSHSRAGLASGMFMIAALFGRLYSGKRIERFGQKRTLRVALISGLALTLLYFKVNGMTSLLVIRFLHGASFGIASTAAGTIVANVIPRKRCGEGLGYYMLSVTLALAAGPFLGIFINRHGGYGIIFLVCTIFATLSLAASLFLSSPEIELTREELKATRDFNLGSLFELKAVPISIICGVVIFCYSSILAFLASYSKEIHLVEAASLLFVVYAVVVLVSRPVVGRIFDSRGENVVMYPAIVIFALGLAVLSQSHHGYAILAAGALIGLGAGAVQSATQAIAVKSTPPQRMGLANATYFAFSDVAVGTGPFVFGLLVPSIGFRGVYVSAGILALSCTFLYHALHGKGVSPQSAADVPTTQCGTAKTIAALLQET